MRRLSVDTALRLLSIPIIIREPKFNPSGFTAAFPDLLGRRAIDSCNEGRVVGCQETFNFTDGRYKVLSEFVMRNFSYHNEKAGSGPHDGISFIWLVANAKIPADRYPPSSSYFSQPNIIWSILVKMVVMPLNG
jgi:hypothetical protein